ncbi:MAG: hypothetical protein KDB26_01900 [Microthrixaceae bacterium]|nr:hypothetical protein [Microthrixaceae bacterium]
MSNDHTPASKEPAAGPKGAAARVSEVHAQARPTFVLAALFALAAMVVAPLDNNTGLWLPLHLLMVGTFLSAILGATQLLAVTWSSSPAPARRLADAQRVALVIGVIGVATGRELGSDSSAGKALVGIGGTGVIVALVLLIVSLVKIRKGAVTDRYVPAIWGYVAAACFGIVGVSLGAVIASGGLVDDYNTIRGIHLTANALGLVGIVILSTLPYFLATQARMKMAKVATAQRISIAIAGAAVATAVSLVGWLIGSNVTAAVGTWAYAAVLVGSIWLFPRVGRKQLDWAGPRLLQLASGYLWWIVALILLGCSALWDKPTLQHVLVLMAVGGFAQIVSSSLNYFAPVITAGKRKPGEGLRLTRSWASLIGGNIAALGVAIAFEPMAVIGVVIWVGDMIYRFVLLMRFSRETNASEAA